MDYLIMLATGLMLGGIAGFALGMTGCRVANAKALDAEDNWYDALRYMKSKGWWAQARALEAGKHRDAKDVTP